ncbi:hypothetical protein ABTC85_15740 [Acinetobacter baumannii]|uniref:Uncharacterized protein n=1 Tax=Acinetobacter baumannii TaxID=470 RepID=A0A0C4Y2P0_ACIBA|nr:MULTISPECIES: hypothetical protein [Acinetobacter calcoaceticus/baumannii complex]AFI97446.1 hypothetical protein ABTJ_p0068 [Acinetobacter baumannii MDR-TJ]AGQ12338.1 hypothetical protein BJAB0868_p0081 [Acinetobacter baumannii BJAB0868]AGQ16199.1 hypothetical protein BJAB07104_p0071 [Acinetobacter baumannii BJAB07104]AJF79916.1 hypothetical protein NG19_0080 [Acinetobacter baumannii]APF45760.1 hypothetical protein BKJ37_19700 [Acinetobacter baumannii]
MTVTENATMKNVSNRIYEDREAIQLLINPTYKYLLTVYSRKKELPFNYVLSYLVGNAVNDPDLLSEIKRIQPQFKGVKGKNTPFRLDTEIAKRFKEVAKTQKGDLYSSFVNAAIYYFLKHGDFEKMPELQALINNEINTEEKPS